MIVCLQVPGITNVESGSEIDLKLNPVCVGVCLLSWNMCVLLCIRPHSSLKTSTTCHDVIASRRRKEKWKDSCGQVTLTVQVCSRNMRSIWNSWWFYIHAVSTRTVGQHLRLVIHRDNSSCRECPNPKLRLCHLRVTSYQGIHILSLICCARMTSFYCNGDAMQPHSSVA